jgi:hypothetical protein
VQFNLFAHELHWFEARYFEAFETTLDLDLFHVDPRTFGHWFERRYFEALQTTLAGS